MTTDTRPATPWHLWVMGIIALLFDGMGALKFVMTMTRNEEYLAAFTAEQLEYFYGMPWLVNYAWAVAVWGGVLASVMLLLRKAVAVRLFTLALVCMVATATYNFGLSAGMDIMGTEGLISAAISLPGSLVLVLYSRAMRLSGVLS